eukprot:6562877-Karenia_brevis.AAC.1
MLHHEDQHRYQTHVPRKSALDKHYSNDKISHINFVERNLCPCDFDMLIQYIVAALQGIVTSTGCRAYVCSVPVLVNNSGEAIVTWRQ